MVMDGRSSHLRHLLDTYEAKKTEIKERLREFEEMGKEGEKEIFAELCFCILTPQSKAKVCDSAIKKLVKNNVLFEGSQEGIRQFLDGVRFPNNKARYIAEARDFLSMEGRIKIKENIDSFGDVQELREWLATNIKGMGYKEASHFLRNIGRGEDLAILDRHILRNLESLGIVGGYKGGLTKRRYLEYESKMRQFARRVNISLAELDLLFWSEETGEIFK